MSNRRTKSQIMIMVVLICFCVGMIGRLIYRLQSDNRFAAKTLETVSVDESGKIEEATLIETEEQKEAEGLEMTREELIEGILLYEMQIPLAENAITMNGSNLKTYETAFEDFEEVASRDTLREELVQQYYANVSADILLIKTEILIGLGYSTGFSYTPQSEMEGFTDSLGESVINELSGKVADGVTQQVLAGGISGAVEGIREGDDLSETVVNIWEGMESGFVAGIQDAPREFLKAAIGVDLISVLEVLENIQSMDEVPDYLVTLLRNDLSSYAAKIQGFLEDDFITSEELSEAIYWYYQYLDAITMINQLSGREVIEVQHIKFDRIDLDMYYERFKRDEHIYSMLTGDE